MLPSVHFRQAPSAWRWKPKRSIPIVRWGAGRSPPYTSAIGAAPLAPAIALRGGTVGLWRQFFLQGVCFVGLRRYVLSFVFRLAD